MFKKSICSKFRIVAIRPNFKNKLKTILRLKNKT